MKGSKNKIKNWILPNTKLIHDEFVSGIHKAEEGPFYSVPESMKHFEEWLKARKTK